MSVMKMNLLPLTKLLVLSIFTFICIRQSEGGNFEKLKGFFKKLRDSGAANKDGSQSDSTQDQSEKGMFEIDLNDDGEEGNSESLPIEHVGMFEIDINDDGEEGSSEYPPIEHVRESDIDLDSQKTDVVSNSIPGERGVSIILEYILSASGCSNDMTPEVTARLELVRKLIFIEQLPIDESAFLNMVVESMRTYIKTGELVFQKGNGEQLILRPKEAVYNLRGQAEGAEIVFDSDLKIIKNALLYLWNQKEHAEEFGVMFILLSLWSKLKKIDYKTLETTNRLKLVHEVLFTAEHPVRDSGFLERFEEYLRRYIETGQLMFQNEYDKQILQVIGNQITNPKFQPQGGELYSASVLNDIKSVLRYLSNPLLTEKEDDEDKIMFIESILRTLKGRDELTSDKIARFDVVREILQSVKFPIILDPNFLDSFIGFMKHYINTGALKIETENHRLIMRAIADQFDHQMTESEQELYSDLFFKNFLTFVRIMFHSN